MTRTSERTSTEPSADRNAFDALVREALPIARGFIWRMIGQPEDCEDVLQEAQLKAWQAFDSFDGRSKFSTWFTSVAARSAIDHLRGKRRWRRESQIAYANLCATSDDFQGEIIATMSEPEFAFDVKEHVAYCFVCIGRSLPPDEQAALVLRDVMGFSNREASNVLGTSDSVLRHRLSAAREAMEGRYEGLCALVNKAGMCHQCTGLGEAAKAVGAESIPLPDIDDMASRMAIVRGIGAEGRKGASLHDLFFRRCADIEEKGLGVIVPEDCD